MDLKNLNLAEMNSQEMREIEGGYSWPEFKQDCKDLWQDVKDFGSGLASGWNAAN